MLSDNWPVFLFGVPATRSLSSADRPSCPLPHVSSAGQLYHRWPVLLQCWHIKAKFHSSLGSCRDVTRIAVSHGGCWKSGRLSHLSSKTRLSIISKSLSVQSPVRSRCSSSFQTWSVTQICWVNSTTVVNWSYIDFPMTDLAEFPLSLYKASIVMSHWWKLVEVAKKNHVHTTKSIWRLNAILCSSFRYHFGC